MDEIFQSITFSQFVDGDDHTTETNTSRTIEGHRSESLTTLLDEFALFLRSIGYSYLAEIKAVTDNGLEFTSNDPHN